MKLYFIKCFARITFLTILFIVLPMQTLLRAESKSLACSDMPGELKASVILLGNLVDINANQVSEPLVVLRAIFKVLPQQIRVMPTENYLYLEFNIKKEKFRGNIRFDIHDRELGVFYFAYYSDISHYQAVYYKKITCTNGFCLRKKSNFTYVISHNNKEWRINLNKMRSYLYDAAQSARVGEIFIGPIFDESCEVFSLIYNPEIDSFIYVHISESARNNHFSSGKRYSVWLDKRTGFLYFIDRNNNRIILIGVSKRHVASNSYFDGPFDQMPDNFISNNIFRKLIIQLYPEYDGRVSRYGYIKELGIRIVISPYIEYEKNPYLKLSKHCTADNSTFYECWRSFNQ